MRRPLIAAALAALLAAPAQAQRPKEDLVDQVKNSIDRGIQFLRQNQSNRGEWERGGIGGFGITKGGQTCLAMLALLNAGVKPDDPVIQAGLNSVRGLPQQGTYVVSLQTMVLAETGNPRDLLQIQSNVNWLLQSIAENGNGFVGWSYGAGMGRGGDFSNTQYALLGLHAGKQAGAKIDERAWRIILNLYKDAQNPEGTWGYTVADRSPRLTMTLAGLSSLVIAGMELTRGRQQLDHQTGIAKACGQYDEDPNIRRALEWLTKPGNFTFDAGQHKYYCIYGIERAGRLTGQRFMADRDWYREGCQYLVEQQQQDGSWNGGMGDGATLGASAFALLFLSKGRTPTLISKFAWGAAEWNNKHHDAKNMVEYASRELFKKTPLAWQVYDARRAAQNKITEHAGELLQSPIVYFNGHEAPRLTGVQKDILKKYIQEGGFVLGEACCGDPNFAKGFRDLMKELFDKDMVPVTADHAVYHAHTPLTPAQAAMFPLERLDLGCKTVVILATKPLAGYWEENLVNDPRGSVAFKLAGNIVAYATNMELPKPKLTKTELSDDKLDIKLPRNYLKVAQIRHEGDWEPAPQAMRNLMMHLRTTAKLDVALQKDAVSMGTKNLFQYRFLYMHGRRGFNFAEEELKFLRMNLKTGGLLLADACCGSKEFDKAFRDMVAKLFPESKFEAILENDLLYSSELNGAKIERVKCRRPRDGDGPIEMQDMRPALEGIKQGKRWVVIYSKYDLGCALEKHPSSDCIGHDHESALKLAGAAVLYYLRN